MLQVILQLAESAERIMGQVYAHLARYLDESSPPYAVLKRLAAEEERHAQVMGQLLEILPAEYPEYDFEPILSGQAEFINCCSKLLTTDPVSLEELTGYFRRLVQLEGKLSDNLFLHFKMMVDDEHKEELEQLAKASSQHAKLLTQFLPPEERNLASIIPD